MRLDCMAIDIEAQKKKIEAAGGYAHLAESVHAPE